MDTVSVVMASNEIISRQKRLTEELQNIGMESVVLSPGPAFFYFTGLPMTAMERPVVLFLSVHTEPVFVLPNLEVEQLSNLSFAHEVFSFGENPIEWQFSFDQAAAYCGIFDRVIGIEEEQLRVFILRHLQESAWTTKFVHAGETLNRLRINKDASEIDCMREAVRVAEQAFEETIDSVKVGDTEKEIAGRLFVNLVSAGSSPDLPFQPIVAAGPNSAKPHAEPSDRPLESGDILLIDWGANVEHYYSDLTRVVSLGDPEPDLARIAEIVVEANAAARDIAGPGVRAGAVDAAARDVIASAGYGAMFTHRTGHGLGLAVHEAPFIRGDSDQTLEDGMTFTIEPGVYMPGKGGVRIEDDVVITNTGCESLSTIERTLRAI